MKNQNLELKELSFSELEETNGGLLIEALALGCTVIAGIYYLGAQCAAYDQRHGY